MSAVVEHERYGPVVDYPRDTTVAEAFIQQAVRTPDGVAVIAGATSLCYRDLDARSGELAACLKQQGVGPGSLVGLAVERNTDLMVAMLGILKAGGAYVPLDPSYPRERLAWIIEDSEMKVLIATSHTRSQLPSLPDGPAVILTDTVRGQLESIDARGSSTDLAYVTYTSGSTGKPKGVMIEHRNVLNFFAAMDQVLGTSPGVWLAVTSISFDISVLELLWTLTRGFTVVLHGEDGWSGVADEIQLHGVTHLQMTPSLARLMMLDTRAFASLGGLSKMLLGGEAVPSSLIRKLRQVFHGEILNMYGPTETTVWSTCSRVEEPGTTVSIGTPIANTQVYLLDAALQPVPHGEPGELFIGGDGVARGYLNRPELTSERFLSLPVCEGRRVYRTGDLVKFRPDGGLDFLGRNDYQIKLRGHRIEPGEIEAVLEQMPGIRQSVIVLREDREGDPRLVAYVVPEASVQVHGTALRAALAERLPEIMVPSAVVLLPRLPMTDNGKIDRKALLNMPPPQADPVDHAGHSTGSRHGLAELVARAWQDALGVGAFSYDENFFDLGAHSLTVAEVHSRLQETLNREISLVDLFQFPTINALAAHLEGAAVNGGNSDRAQRRRLARQR
jgi:amino acid adenylation domain-containing protein